MALAVLGLRYDNLTVVVTDKLPRGPLWPMWDKAIGVKAALNAVRTLRTLL